MDSAALSELRGAISVVKQSWNKCAGAVPALLCRESCLTTSRTKETGRGGEKEAHFFLFPGDYNMSNWLNVKA